MELIDEPVSEMGFSVSIRGHRGWHQYDWVILEDGIPVYTSLKSHDSLQACSEDLQKFLGAYLEDKLIETELDIANAPGKFQHSTLNRNNYADKLSGES